MIPLWQYVVLYWPTLLSAAALALAGGTGGVFVILRRQTLLVLSLPQIVTLGAAIGLRMEWPTLPPAAGCVAIALLLVAISARAGSTHLLLPALYVAGTCLSILVVAGAAAELVHVQNLFVGIDVAVTPSDAWLTAVVLIPVAVLIAICWRRWVLLAQAPIAAELAQLRPARWDALFLSLVSLILIVGINTLGAAMAIVMLFVPAAAILPWARQIPQAIGLAMVAGLIFLAVGFLVSIEMDWPLSQTVGGVGVAAVFVSHLGARWLRRG